VIPALHPQWADVDLGALLARDVAFFSLGAQNSILNAQGAVQGEGIWQHGRAAGGSFTNTLDLARVCRRAGMRFFWFRWERFRHRYPGSRLDEAQYRYWLRDFKGDLDAQRVWNADLVDEVKALMEPDDVNLVYPGFGSVFAGTPAQMYLTMWGIRTVLLTGYHTEWCIETAARNARDIGLMPVVVGDACAAETPEIHVGTLRRLNDIFAPVISTATAIQLIDAGTARRATTPADARR
jgi:nicotinamidase-related amidase